MKNLVSKVVILLIALVVFSSTDAIAQKKKTYLKNVKVTFKSEGYNIEYKSKPPYKDGVIDCKLWHKPAPFRITVTVDGETKGKLGNSSAIMAGQYYLIGKGAYPEKYKNDDDVLKVFKYEPYTVPVAPASWVGNKIYIGEYSSNEEFEIKWDFWLHLGYTESWKYNKTYDRDLNDHYTTASASRGHIKYGRKAFDLKCVEITYDVVQE